MTEKEKQFEERLDALILLKALLLKNNEFNEVEQKKYQGVWNKVFKLLDWISKGNQLEVWWWLV